MKAKYQANSENKKAALRAYSKAQYSLSPDKKAHSKARYKATLPQEKSSSHACYQRNQDSIHALKRDRYALAEPKPEQNKLYMKNIQGKMLNDVRTKCQLILTFN